MIRYKQIFKMGITKEKKRNSKIINHRIDNNIN